MIASVNVFTRGVGYSHWEIDLGFTLLPKHEIKRILVRTMDSWFMENKHVYARTRRYKKDRESFIVHITFR